MSNYTRIVKNMADADYRNEVGVSQSMLKPFFVSPAHYKHQFTVEREVTQAMIVGTATHLACFQPALYDSSVAVSQKFDKRKTEDKIAYAKFQEENAGKIILSQDENALCLDMAEQVRSHPMFYQFCTKGDAEVSVFSDVLPFENIRLKGRLDWVNWDAKCVFDLKTTNASLSEMYKVKNVFLDNMYHMQAAYYLTLLQHNGFDGFRFFFIMVEKEAPHGVRVFEVSEKSIKRQMELINLALAKLEHCVQHDAWVSYETDSTIIDI